MPTPVRQAFDSFEVLATNSSGVQQPSTAGVMQSQQNNATATATTTNPFSSNSTTGRSGNSTTNLFNPEGENPIFG